MKLTAIKRISAAILLLAMLISMTACNLWGKQEQDTDAETQASAEAATNGETTKASDATQTPVEPIEVKISTAEELLAAASKYGDFEGVTLKLTADIDLNPGWSASVAIGNTVQFPNMPPVVWTPIQCFKGVLDGDGHVLSGLYVTNVVSDGKGAYGGLFHTLDGGTVKNLAITNSFILASNDGAGGKDVHVGGLAGDVNAGSALETVFVDAEVWFMSDAHCVLGGALGFANGQYTVNGYVFAGRIGNTDRRLTASYSTPTGKKLYMGQLIGCQNRMEDRSISNVLSAGDKHTGNGQSQTEMIGVDAKQNYSCCLVGKTDQAFLESGENGRLYASWVYNKSLASIVPGALSRLINTIYGVEVMETRILLASDIHLCHKEWFGVDSDVRVQKFIDDVRAEYERQPFDALLLLGDYSLDHWKWNEKGSYIELGISNTKRFVDEYLSQLSDLPIEIRMIAGNHEQYGEELYFRLTGYHREDVYVTDEFLFILMDTYQDGLDPTEHHDGMYTGADVEFVKEQMAAYPDKKVIICSHYLEHWKDTEEFKEILRDERVICMVQGHTHKSEVWHNEEEYGSTKTLFTGQYGEPGSSAAGPMWGFREIILTEDYLTSSYITPANTITQNGETVSYPYAKQDSVTISFK